ncbi:MAG: MJ0042-type zinc finger domain-containing protein [Devosia sp.]
MSSPDLQTVVIACPNCGTRYQVPFATIGAAGREVQCAQCSKPWHAMADIPPPAAIDEDILFPGQETALDAAFEAEARALEPAHPAALPQSLATDPEYERTLAEIKAAIAPKAKKAEINAIDPALLKKSTQSFNMRQAKLSKRLPMARLRRTARLAALIALVGLLLAGFVMRTEIVRAFPSLAGLYSAIGLPVNVVGLEFEASKTLTSFRDGKPVMLITAKIRSVASRVVPVPPVLVSLLDAKDAIVYEWTVTPKAPEMEPGEIQEFSTEINAPPDGAAKVRLSFINSRGTAAFAETK